MLIFPIDELMDDQACYDFLLKACSALIVMLCLMIKHLMIVIVFLLWITDVELVVQSTTSSPILSGVNLTTHVVRSF